MKQIHCVLCVRSRAALILRTKRIMVCTNMQTSGRKITSYRGQKKSTLRRKKHGRECFHPFRRETVLQTQIQQTKRHTHTKQSESFRKKHQLQLRHNRPKKCHERPFCSPAFPSQPVRLNEVSGMYTRVRTQNIPRGNGRKR